MKKKDHIYVLGLCLFVVILVILFLYPGKMFGSVTDWISQHSVFPDYFRTLFYDTKQVFPSLAMNIGGGQNIYYFSYYGYLSPIILLSYLLPFIKMVDYIMISSLFCILISIYLFYRFLKNHGFSSFVCLIVTFLFTCSAPLLFHSHRHVMFVNYMPFLLLGLMGIDLYFQKDKKWLYALSVFLMIMTSYYYSVGGLLVFVIYGIYVYLKNNKNISFQQFMKDGIRFLLPMFVGILMSCVLLLPTAYALFQGRVDSSGNTDLLSLFIPNFDFNYLLYSNYSLGLTAISIIALVGFIFMKKKENIFLGISLLLVSFLPIFLYILNGTIYIRAKALIPFLPLFCLVIAFYLHSLIKYKFSLKQHIMLLIGICVVGVLSGYHEIWFYLDLLLYFGCVFLYLKFNQKKFFIPMCFMAIVPFVVSQLSDEYVLKSDYNSIFSKDKMNLVRQAIQQDDDFYRFSNLNDTLETINYIYDPHYYQTSLYSSSYNPFYKNFVQFEIGNAVPYRNQLITAQSNNIMFQKLMGVRYVLSKVGHEPIGYELISKKGEYGIYKNSDVLSIGYATSDVMSLSDYELLSFPYRNEVLLHQVVVDQDVSYDYKSNIKEIDLDYTVELPDTVSVDETDGLVISVSDKSNVILNLSEPIDGDILFIRFDLEPMDCKVGDSVIRINDIQNNLTCKQWMYYNDNTSFEYTISSNEPITELNVALNEGIYDLKNIKTYVLNYDKISSIHEDFDLMEVDMDKTYGDVITGEINVSKDGYFASTIPYDEGFTVYVDGIRQDYEIVNQAFIGFPIISGKHYIEFVYEAPFLKYGMIGSGVGFILFGVFIWVDKRNKYH